MSRGASRLCVRTRSGAVERVSFDKIQDRIEALSSDLSSVNVTELSQSVIAGLVDGITTVELDRLAEETAAARGLEHPDWLVLAARLAVSALHKDTGGVAHTFASVRYKRSDAVESAVKDKAAEIAVLIDYGLDYGYDYFGIKTLQRGYLLPGERPQDLLMRVAIGLWGAGDWPQVALTYRLLSERRFTFGTPGLFSIGTPVPQAGSCFLVAVRGDSTAGIYSTLMDCAEISHYSGGLGVSTSNVRAAGSRIKGTNGRSNGLVPMARVFNEMVRHIDQGGGKRKGSLALYLEPWHADVIDFLQLKRNDGAPPERRARDLFYALWVPDLFMRRVDEDADWSLFCPADAPGLQDVYGADFDALYESYEQSGVARRVMKARALWREVIASQINTGMPYILYKDACNRMSNHRHLGTIRSSNLCTEIIQYSSPTETAVCNLASVALPRFVNDGVFDFRGLETVVAHMVACINRVIDVNVYATAEAKRSNMAHRPMGIGVQGLADVFAMAEMPFDSREALELNVAIFEHIYYAALKASCALARVEGVYDSYKGSPVSRGKLHPDVCMGAGWEQKSSVGVSRWSALRGDIARWGVRNSLLVAAMPTASTSQILGNSECFEPYCSNLFMRRTLAGEFLVVNPHLFRALNERGLWDKDMRDALVHNKGSVKDIARVPESLRSIFKTVWEIRAATLIDMAAARLPFIDQSQSMNVYMRDPDLSRMSKMHFYGWRKGLKTGMYYLHSRSASDALQFSLAKRKEVAVSKPGVCTRDAAGCDSCDG